MTVEEANAIEILTYIKNTPGITWTNGADIAFDLAIDALGICKKIKAIIDNWAVDDDEHELLEQIADIIGGEK